MSGADLPISTFPLPDNHQLSFVPLSPDQILSPTLSGSPQPSSARSYLPPGFLVPSGLSLRAPVPFLLSLSPRSLVPLSLALFSALLDVYISRLWQPPFQSDLDKHLLLYSLSLSL